MTGGCCQCRREPSAMIGAGDYMCAHLGECPTCPSHQLADQARNFQSFFQGPSLGQYTVDYAPILARLDRIEKLLTDLLAAKASA